MESKNIKSKLSGGRLLKALIAIIMFLAIVQISNSSFAYREVEGGVGNKTNCGYTNLDVKFTRNWMQTYTYDVWRNGNKFGTVKGSKDVIATEDGEYRTFVPGAGSYEAYRKKIIIDKTEPSVKLSVNYDSRNRGGDTIITIEAADSISGLNTQVRVYNSRIWNRSIL